MRGQTNRFDAIVVGSGISGGWAAKELCEKGLKTLILERGREVKHGDYPTAQKDSWDMTYKGRLSQADRSKFPVQNRAGFVNDYNQHFYVDDIENRCDETSQFDWIRGYQTGGRSLIWGRQCYRWSDLDYNANAKEGIGIDWPIRYKDIEPWYDYVEKFVGVSGDNRGIPHLPDGQFLPPMELNCLEKHVQKSIETNFPGRYMTSAGLLISHKQSIVGVLVSLETDATGVVLTAVILVVLLQLFRPLKILVI